MDNWDMGDLSDLEKIGDKVQDIIESAVNSKNFRKLNQSITQAVNETVRQYQKNQKKEQEPMRASERTARRQARNGTYGYEAYGEQGGRQTAVRKSTPGQVVQPWDAYPERYRPLTGERVKGILQTVFGGILTGSMSIGLLTVSLIQMVTGHGGIGPIIVMIAGMAAGSGLLAKGISRIGKVGRFQKYSKALGTHTYCDFPQLARAAGKSVKYVKKDIKKMVETGWFLEGHVDSQETCLITSNETYQQYEESRKSLEERKREEEKKLSEKEKRSPEVQSVLDKGNTYIQEIRRCNDAIPGEEISEKISRIEQIVRQIFRRAEEHPEIISDLKRMMDYYLPMTVKLLNAYAEMDAQPVQGENILSSKKEIEETLDTLNEAFGKLLDSVFQDTAWDLSSDISVLHTVLAQEGLTENDFTIK